MRLRITETFLSIQGESTLAGRATAFIRLTGCDLRCSWCDSEYTFTGGDWRAVEDLVTWAVETGAPCACVTGGEPMLQKDVLPLMTALCDAGLTVSLETGGHRDLSAVDPRVRRIVDLKPPASGMADRNRWENLALLGERDEIKLVLADRADYEWGRDALRRTGIADRVGAVHVSPVHGQLAPDELAAWMLEDKLPARLQLQLHKYVWGADARGV